MAKNLGTKNKIPKLIAHGAKEKLANFDTSQNFDLSMSCDTAFQELQNEAFSSGIKSF